LSHSLKINPGAGIRSNIEVISRYGRMRTERHDTSALAAYDAAATRLAAMFRANFAAFADGVPPAVAAAGPGAPGADAAG